MNATTCDWLDGPKFIAWLNRQVPLGDKLDRYMRGQERARHNAGAPVHLYRAEELCHRLERHIYDVPDDVFIEKPVVVYLHRCRERSARWYRRNGMPDQADRYRKVAA